MPHVQSFLLSDRTLEDRLGFQQAQVLYIITVITERDIVPGSDVVEDNTGKYVAYLSWFHLQVAKHLFRTPLKCPIAHLILQLDSVGLCTLSYVFCKVEVDRDCLLCHSVRIISCYIALSFKIRASWTDPGHFTMQSG